MAAFDTVWAQDDNALIDTPSEAEIEAGFSCGKVTPGRFNWIIQSLMSAINAMDLTDVLSRFRRINTTEGITGGGDLTEDRTLRLDINGLEEEASIANGDMIPVFDVSANAHRKMTRSNFVAGLGGEGGVLIGGDNVGTGTGEVYSGNNAGTLEFRTIKAGSGVTVVTAGNDVTVSLADMGAALTY